MNENMKVQPVIPEEQKQFFCGGKEELIELLGYIEKNDELCQKIKIVSNEGKKLKKELEDINKNIEKEMSDTINCELNKYIEEENCIINEMDSALKENKNKRNKKKQKEIKNRISEETFQYYDENKETRRFIRRTLKENSLPAFCDTKWFYLLYCTQGLVENLVKFLIFALALIFVPYIFVKIINPWFLLKGVLWIVLDVVFIAIYLTIFLVSKDKDTGTLEQIREYREKISDNNKKIKKIKKKIKKDTDESGYDLEEFDKKISECEENLGEAKKQKESKVKQFENDRKPCIIEEISEKYRVDIEDKENEISCKTEEFQNLNKEFCENEKILNQNYEKYIPKAYLNTGCVRRMLELVEGGNAKNIGEAFEIVK